MFTFVVCDLVFQYLPRDWLVLTKNDLFCVVWDIKY